MSELSDSAAVLFPSTDKPDAPPEEANEQQAPPELEVVPPEGESAAPNAETEESAPAEEPESEFSEEMYALKVPGTEFTVGELKDRAKDLARTEEMQAEAEADRQKAQSESLQARETLQTLVSTLGLQFTPEQVEQAQALMGQTQAQNDKLAMQNISGWDDSAVREAERERSADLLTEYMFSPAEADAARDWRFQRLVRDFAALRERVSKAVKGEKKPKTPKPGSASRKTSASDADRAVADYKAGRVDQTTAVAALLTGGTK